MNKGELLKIIVEEYVKSAVPVGSKLVVKKYLPDLSSATVRNYMAELENQGLIQQPHTSAGRIPTISGYQRYIDNFLTVKEINTKSQKAINKLVKKNNNEDDIKNLAKKLAELSGEAILIGFSPQNVYYTGISNLFSQPEFQQHSLVYSMSEVIDHLDETMVIIFNQIGEKIKILIGNDNPFGSASSVVLAKYKTKKYEGMIGILGPNRMNYQENVGLLEYVKDKMR